METPNQIVLSRTSMGPINSTMQIDQEKTSMVRLIRIGPEVSYHLFDAVVFGTVLISDVAPASSRH